ncbi:metal ABC transporter solute-binding protein, Zn/Mn family [Luethyella okanaganae]|uniref:Metal ABC transporter solute-binding protein, Zn/Mn family n=1 Tax=Luethyella okanaganae TaxID=69372 RepID=A0ABW1VEN6_9MICO
MKTRTFVSLLAVPLTAALALTGCSSGGSGASAGASDDAKVSVVASTNVYGDIVSAIAGDNIAVTSIMSNPAQDPHSFEVNAQNQLAVSKADIVIENGGGYDDFMGTLLDASGNEDAVVLNVFDISGKADGVNEHVWYDFASIGKLKDALVEALSKADPAGASTFEKNGKGFSETLAELESRQAELKTKYDGQGVAVSEPVPLYLLEGVGLVDKTPEAFSQAVEEGVDVSPAVLQETIDAVVGGSVRLLVYNEQTSGPETEKVLAAAEGAGVPVVPVTETLPNGEDYLSWMRATLDAVAKALGA